MSLSCNIADGNQREINQLVNLSTILRVQWRFIPYKLYVMEILENMETPRVIRLYSSSCDKLFSRGKRLPPPNSYNNYYFKSYIYIYIYIKINMRLCTCTVGRDPLCFLWVCENIEENIFRPKGQFNTLYWTLEMCMTG